MQRPFHLLNEVRHAVEAQSRPKRAEIPRLDVESGCSDGRGRDQTTAKRVVHDIAKRTAGSTRQRLQLGCHILI